MIQMAIGVLALNQTELWSTAGLFVGLIVFFMFVHPPVLYVSIVMIFLGGMLPLVAASKNNGPEKLDLDVSAKKVKVGLVGSSGLGILAGGLLLMIYALVQGGIDASKASAQDVRDKLTEARSTSFGQLVIPERILAYFTVPNPSESPNADELKADPEK